MSFSDRISNIIISCERPVEKTVRKRVHSCMCRSVTIGDILNFGITADVFLYARRLEIKLTYSLMFVLLVCSRVVC